MAELVTTTSAPWTLDSPWPLKDLGSQFGEPVGGCGVTQVGAGDAISQGKQHFGNSTHADAADSDKMNALNFCEHDS